MSVFKGDINIINKILEIYLKMWRWKVLSVGDNSDADFLNVTLKLYRNEFSDFIK